MAITHPNLTLTLEALAPSGVLLSTEEKAAVHCSLALKSVEVDKPNFQLWGKFHTRNGKNYVVASAASHTDKQPQYYFSQGGTSWMELESIDEAVASTAETFVLQQLSGDPGRVWETSPPKSEDDTEEQEEAAADEATAAPSASVTELQRLRALVDAISAATALVPQGVSTARDSLAGKGPSYPEKLESYLHAQGPLAGQSLAKDVRGVWTLRHDPLQGVTTGRSLLWPGFSFFYNSRSGCWGSYYVGNGIKNTDLVFML